MGVSLLNFFDLKPLNTSKRPLNVNHTFFRDALYLKDVYEAERSQNPEHVFHDNMGKLKAVKGENP